MSIISLVNFQKESQNLLAHRTHQSSFISARVPDLWTMDQHIVSISGSIRWETEQTISVMPLNHPQTMSSILVGRKNCLSWNQFQAPKTLGTAVEWAFLLWVWKRQLYYHATIVVNETWVRVSPGPWNKALLPKLWLHGISNTWVTLPAWLTNARNLMTALRFSSPKKNEPLSIQPQTFTRIVTWKSQIPYLSYIEGVWTHVLLQHEELIPHPAALRAWPPWLEIGLWSGPWELRLTHPRKTQEKRDQLQEMAELHFAQLHLFFLSFSCVRKNTLTREKAQFQLA